DIILPADVASETILKAKAKMADYFCLTVEMMTLCVDGRKFVRQTRNRLRRHGIAFAAAEDCTNSRPTVRGKATAWNRVAQRQCAKDRSDSALLVDVVANKDAIE